MVTHQRDDRCHQIMISDSIITVHKSNGSTRSGQPTLSIHARSILCYAQIYPRRVASSLLPTTPCSLCTSTKIPTKCLALTQLTTHLLHTHSKPKQLEAERKHLHHPQHPYRIPHNCLSCPRVRHPGQQLRFCNGLTRLCGPHRFGLLCPFLHPLNPSELGLPYSLKGRRVPRAKVQHGLCSWDYT